MGNVFVHNGTVKVTTRLQQNTIRCKKITDRHVLSEMNKQIAVAHFIYLEKFGVASGRPDADFVILSSLQLSSEDSVQKG